MSKGLEIIVLPVKATQDTFNQIPDVGKVISVAWLGTLAQVVKGYIPIYNDLVDIFAGLLTIGSAIFVFTKLIDLHKDMKYKKRDRKSKKQKEKEMNKRKFTVIIDDGHGEDTRGKRSPEFVRDTMIDGTIYKKGEQFLENTFNFKVATFLVEKLLRKGVYSVLLKPERKDISLKERVKREKEIYTQAMEAEGESLLVSIHANKHEPNGQLVWNDASGIETYHHPKSKEGKRLALEVHSSVMENCELINRGIKTKPIFYIIRNSYSPAILFEGGFMTNEKDLLYLGSENYQKEVAEKIAIGIMRYIENS